jgi:L-amino acid N-acyltransferase YncA
MTVTIGALRSEDWEAVSAIYAEGIATGNATFETEVPRWEHWDARHLENCRLVARRDGRVIGWTALSPVSARAVYRGVVEESIYIAGAARGQGVGKLLLTAVIEASEVAGLWMLQTSIFPENTASIALHQACGFRAVGQRERIAKLHGMWRNTVFMERRSQVVGVDDD